MSHAAVTAVACFLHHPCGVAGWLLMGDPEALPLRLLGEREDLGGWVCPVP